MLLLGNLTPIRTLPGQNYVLLILETVKPATHSRKTCLDGVLLGLVVEDAISGLKSGRAAGSKTLAVCTSTARNVIVESNANPDFIVENLTKCVGYAIGPERMVFFFC